MLVLSRKIEQEIIIGDNVSIKVLGVAGNKVRLGISAPGSISIRRAEIPANDFIEFHVPVAPAENREPAHVG